MRGYAWKYDPTRVGCVSLSKLQWSHEWLRMEMHVMTWQSGSLNTLQWSHEWLRMEMHSQIKVIGSKFWSFNGAMSGYAWKFGRHGRYAK